MGVCLARFSHFIQITGDLLFTCIAHSSGKKKVGHSMVEEQVSSMAGGREVVAFHLRRSHSMHLLSTNGYLQAYPNIGNGLVSSWL